VVNDIIFNFDNNVKQLCNFADEIKEQLAEKSID
jgi:hypothetical protein